MKKALVAIIIILSTMGVFLLCGYFSSHTLAVETYAVKLDLAEKIVICHLSDLHYPKNGVSLPKIIDAVMMPDSHAPDIIVMTGDMLDESADDADVAGFSDFLFSLRKITRVFAVLGNHEVGRNYEIFTKICAENDIDLLIDRSEYIIIKDIGVLLTGINDGRAFSEKNLPPYFDMKNAVKPELTMLLAHRPELIHNYLNGGFNIVFAGHAHGGQARIFNQGIYAPDQGFLPRYTSGRYTVNDTNMFVSRGLGDGNNNFRIYNSYNVIFVTVA